MSHGRAGALDGVRVLDLTRVLAGPYCAMFLGDLGAELVKIEQPGVGDDTRGWGPPFVGGESAYFLCVNRNKKSVTIDLKSAEGVDLLRRLAKSADVLIENFRPGTMERLGLGEEELRLGNPRLVYASLSGFGADGPMSDWPGYDLIVQAWGGLMSITGTPDGEPTKVGVAIIDLVAGLMLGKAIVAALFAREKIGIGQKVDTSLLEAEVACLINAGSNYLVEGKIPLRWGNAHPSIVPYQSFRTSDGYLVIGVASEGIWRRFCQALGRAELADDARFAKNSDRVENRAALIRILSEIFLTRESDTWLKLLNEAEVPCAPVQTIDKVFSADQVLRREMLVEVEHPTAGTVRMAGLPVKFSATPASIRLPPPLLGQHTAQILTSWLGMRSEEINELKRKRVV
ncbi:MAG TPA: CoA transferase [Candidatus Udaeobacter sp.]|jgi:crotonobetainyl-CoA:carnitine CoA-transferase CaiB-like acyl-CoA transferase|nr:CoA transferase [Candidatus Udaeobacter sp.]